MTGITYKNMTEKYGEYGQFDGLKDKFYQQLKTSLDGIQVSSANDPVAGGIALFSNIGWIGLIEILQDPFRLQIIKRNDGEAPHPKLTQVIEILKSFVEVNSKQIVDQRKSSTSVQSYLDKNLNLDKVSTEGISNIVRGMAGIPKTVKGQGRKRKTRKHRSRKQKKTRKH